MNIDISKNYTIFNEKNKNIIKTEMKFYLKIEIIWNFVKPYTNNTNRKPELRITHRLSTITY